MDSENVGPAAPRRSLIDRFEQGILFLVSAAAMRFAAILTVIAMVVSVGAVAWLSIPKPAPAIPPEVAAPAMPGKPTLTAEDLARPDEPRPGPVAREPVAANAPAAPSTATKIADPPETPLSKALEPYRALATRLGLPFESEHRVMCAHQMFYNQCYSWEDRVVRKGLLDMLKVDVFLDGASDDTQIALLQNAQKLFVAIEGAPASLDSLSGPEGIKVFAASYLQPALDMVQGYRRIERTTTDAVPPDQRLGLVGDLYPSITAAVGALPGAGPVERRAAIGKALALLQRRESQRIKEATGLLRDHSRAVAAREAQIAADERKHAEATMKASAGRIVALEVVASGIGGLVLLGILLALLAIERHLRALRARGASDSSSLAA